uniref:Reverse transcriptase domain-containing protein n=1 Tax=Tanacetum cinerariifolium TaxID=118510 RepID=A0A6L2NC36_TANCI|nr:reverse transcriptase domain-containing protein [Tanacetum cinerariifolium]
MWMMYLWLMEFLMVHFGGDREEDVVMGEGVVVASSSLEMLTKSCLGEMMVRNKQEKDKIGTKPDQIKKKREAWYRIFRKKDKIEAKTDKIKHGMEKREKSKSTKVKVKDRAETEEKLNGPTRTHLMGRPADQDSLNSTTGGNLLERRTQDVLTIIENKSKVRYSRNKSIVSHVKSSDANSSSSFEIAKLTHAVNQQTSAVTTAMTAILKKFQATPPSASAKAVEEICVTCGGAHPYYQCLAADGNTFPEFWDNNQGYVSAAAVNYNQGNSGYRPTEDERVEKTLTDPKLDEFTIKVPPPLVQKAKPPSQRNYVVHQRDPRHPNIPYPSRMHKKKQQEKDEKLLELANTPLNENCSTIILKKLPEKLGDPGKFLIPCGFSELKCKALANLDLFAINYPSGNPTLSSHTEFTSPEVINSLIGSATSSSSPPNHLLEEFTDELGLIIFPLGNYDLPFDIESDLREIEYLLNHDPTKEMDSILKDLVDKDNLVDPNDNLFYTISEMFTDEHVFDYSCPSIYDDFNDDLDEFESNNGDAYDDPFDSKEDKIKESKLLIDELDLLRLSDFLPSPEYDSFLFKDFSEVYAFPLTNNEDKVFNPSILIHKNLSESNVQAIPNKNVKKIAISHASLILEDFDPPLYELPFRK